MTPKQRDALRFIARHQAEHGGVSPSYEELRQELGLASKSGVNRLLVALAEQGLIRRHPNRARALALVPEPADLAAVPDAALLAEVARRGLAAG